MTNKGIGPPDLFDSAWLKWGRAVVHAERLKRDIESWVFTLDGERRGCAVVAKYNPKRHGFALVVEEVDPMPARWGLQLGDTAFGFRSCLDHVVWGMVHRKRTSDLPDDLARDVYFPICDNGDWFNKVVRAQRRMPKVSRADIALVRHVQPYRVSQTRRAAHWLSFLDRINRHDKHRVVQPVGMHPTSVETRVTGIHRCKPGKPRVTYGPSDPLEPDAEIGFIHARRDAPDPQLDVECDITAKPVIERGYPLVDWLQVTSRNCSILLSFLAQPPQELNDIGVENVAFWTR